MCSPVLVSGHALLVDRAGQLLGVGEDVVVVQDHRLHDLVDVRLAGHLVQGVGRGQQGGAEHDGQVPSIHHVLIAVLGEAGGRMGGGGRERERRWKNTLNMNVKVNIELVSYASLA